MIQLGGARTWAPVWVEEEQSSSGNPCRAGGDGEGCTVGWDAFRKLDYFFRSWQVFQGWCGDSSCIGRGGAGWLAQKGGRLTTAIFIFYPCQCSLVISWESAVRSGFEAQHCHQTSLSQVPHLLNGDDHNTSGLCQDEMQLFIKKAHEFSTQYVFHKCWLLLLILLLL